MIVVVEIIMIIPVCCCRMYTLENDIDFEIQTFVEFLIRQITVIHHMGATNPVL